MRKPVDDPFVAAPSITGPAAVPEGSGPRRESVLVVDDNSLNAKLLRLALEARGFLVHCTDCIASARAHVHRSPPHAVLLDAQLTDGDGLTLLREWRQNAALRPFPVVVVSAFAADDDLERAYAAGADAFMPKPIEIRRLMYLVERLIAA